MSQERLSGLVLLSIENERAKNLDFRKVIQQFASEKARGDIPCQLTPSSAFFGRPFPILLKFGMFVGLDEKMSHTEFQVSKLNSF